jgi:hypothetical protein
VKTKAVIHGLRAMINGTGKTSLESKWSDHLLYFHANNYRIRVLFEKRLNPNLPVSDFTKHTLPCMQMIEVLAHECACVSEGIIVTKTIHPIPEPITGMFESITDLGFNTIDYIAFENINNITSSRYERIRKAPRYSIKSINNKSYLYLFNNITLENLIIKLIPKDPMQLAFIPDCEGKINKCFDPYEQEFMIDEELLPLVFQWFAKDILGISMQTGLDVIPDNIDKGNVRNQ